MPTRWFFSLEAVDPRNPADSRWTVGVPEWLYRVKQRKGDERAIARLRLVREVLQGGTVSLYEGWSRPGKDDCCYVYVGKPDRDLKSPSIVTPPPKGMLFLVFILPDGTVDEWIWRHHSEQEGEEDIPMGVNGRLLWSLKKN